MHGKQTRTFVRFLNVLSVCVCFGCGFVGGRNKYQNCDIHLLHSTGEPGEYHWSFFEMVNCSCNHKNQAKPAIIVHELWLWSLQIKKMANGRVRCWKGEWMGKKEREKTSDILDKIFDMLLDLQSSRCHNPPGTWIPLARLAVLLFDLQTNSKNYYCYFSHGWHSHWDEMKQKKRSMKKKKWEKQNRNEQWNNDNTNNTQYISMLEQEWLIVWRRKWTSKKQKCKRLIRNSTAASFKAFA